MAIACVVHASQAYGVPVPVIEHVMRAAGGDGIGPMGIDRRWLVPLARAGFPMSSVAFDDCANIAAGTWIVAYLIGASPAAGGAVEADGRQIPLPLNGEWGSGNRCVITAARENKLPIPLLAAVLATEGGKVGKVRGNTNGSYDIGPAQINSTWLPRLAAQGITEARLLNDGCLNISVGAWILGQEMNGASQADPADYWRRVGNYNSHTPAYNQAYQIKVWQHVASR